MGNIFNTSFLRMLIVKSNCFKQSLGPMLGGHPEMEDVTGFEVNPTFLDAYMNNFELNFWMPLI
jgi:hypothetical protein